ncbi:hypothetical protein EN816_33695 [Mesorhizobium sp. M8A.F.Ca.ET.173.01.1.1]|uniref:hypothetical protein n=1 Tax=Mesorhizobium sp. M8A.F.Ca.ET.167.01.1.1 TaxID=2563961 RepID=UPI000FD2973C|nr:hypothetical protein [Mesorhizobium sp. M8A.F.Ca.ET.167.01.1.1]RUX00902.1 hypothetical protein EOA35_18005 [Mesorhizobium sp. M8A.F.Ca.ET.023.01.1.1]RUX02042.1 hypothetical protein EOA30_18855 [Mesorhizobium sp. M8A.F.Ca.ET.059.01.1.1]RVD53414.1 hypothetical protein EN746_09395 [Mesorhizobium sp. M8A.F.Ca.ET.023.02.2.1]TGT15141.1 hypothetical protein EN856_30250 [Mesorhizobium sp. M8A.F.Ca.ET.213.01.1.1]TGU18158.1 hypothetical protein EN799_61170 [bacterium M00.F.Ca.ET.156.01.1.1]TGV08317.
MVGTLPQAIIFIVCSWNWSELARRRPLEVKCILGPDWPGRNRPGRPLGLIFLDYEPCPHGTAALFAGRSVEPLALSA